MVCAINMVLEMAQVHLLNFEKEYRYCMDKLNTEYAKTYTSFSGCDITCTFGSKIIGELQAISYNVTRERAPVYTFGDANPRSFSRGKRGIAGSMVFAVFNRDALLAELNDFIEQQHIFHRTGGDLNNEPLSIEEWDKAMDDSLGNLTGDAAKDAITKTKAFSVATKPVIADELPPFDVTISMTNEYGSAAVMVLYGVEILNETTQFSMDSIVTQRVCTFVARRIKTLEAVDVSGNTQG